MNSDGANPRETLTLPGLRKASDPATRISSADQQIGTILAPKPKPLPKVAQRDIVDGYVYIFDANGRLCLDIDNRERTVLVHDLRAYGAELHIGVLGWTVPETTDGYTFADVVFDTGHCLRLKRYAFERALVSREFEQYVRKLTRPDQSRLGRRVSCRGRACRSV